MIYFNLNMSGYDHDFRYIYLEDERKTKERNMDCEIEEATEM